MRYAFKHTIKVISRRKRNFCLTAFVIALGISLVVQTQILGTTIERNYEEIFVEAYGNTDIIIFSVNEIYFTQNVSDVIIQGLNSDFEGFLPQIAYSTTAYYPEKGQFEQGVRIETIGSDFNGSFWGHIYSNSTGEKLNVASLQEDEIIISPDLADSLDARIGAQITISLRDERGNPIFHNVTIKNIYSYREYGRTGDPNDFRRILMSEQAVQTLIPSSIDRPITQISVGIEDHNKNPFLGREQSDEAKRQIETILNKNFQNLMLITATIREDNREGLEEGITGLASTFQMFGIVVVIAGLLLIINIQLMNMEEREQQIGMLRAIGAKKRDIFFSYSIETVLAGVLGGIFGLILGIGVGIWLNDLSRDMLSAMGNPEVTKSIFDIVVEPDALLLSFTFAIGLSFVTGMVPALRAQGISIIDIVRGTKSKDVASSINGKRPLWPLIIGGIVIILGLITLVDLIQQGHPFYAPEGFHNIEEEAAANFQALFYVGLGILFFSFRFKRYRRLSLTISGFLLVFLTIWGFHFAIGWADEGGNANSIALTGLLSAVIGATTIVGANLEALTAGLRKGFSYFERTRATGLVATRYINSRKSRAVLTFATFAVILSLNFFIGSYAVTQVSGSSHTWEYSMSGVSMVVESQTPFNLTSLNYPEILQDEFDEIKQVYPLGVGGMLPFRGPSDEITPEEDIFYSKLIAMDFSAFSDNDGEVLYPFVFDSLLPHYTQLSMIKRLEHRDQARDEAKIFWEAFLASQKIHRSTKEPVDPSDPSGLPMFISEGLFFLDIGEIVSFPSTNGSLIEMIYAGRLNYFPSCNLRINEFSSGIIVSSEIVSQLSVLGYGIKEFLIETIHGYDYEKNEVLTSQIEEFSNKDSVDSLLTLSGGTFYGITAHHLWDVFYHMNATNANALNFLQTFISTGLVIGVIGLLVVSHRSVKERKREIGMLRSVGFSKKAVSLAILLELLFLGILGFIVGFLTGNYLAWVFADLVNWKLIIPWSQVGLYGALIMGSVFLAALIPGWLAARIPPSEALRYHG
ncbi:MAG: ABC transporter permease [Candidatus Hodarchaeales archaeon]|jgi:ABC-type antimicrobial peptide transport system permease subunit